MKIETELRNARREIKRLTVELRKSDESLRHYFTRAKNAEKDRDEWRKRFDTLLSKCGLMADGVRP